MRLHDGRDWVDYNVSTHEMYRTLVQALTMSAMLVSTL